jgi:hypothetical protein
VGVKWELAVEGEGGIGVRLEMGKEFESREGERRSEGGWRALPLAYRRC